MQNVYSGIFNLLARPDLEKSLQEDGYTFMDTEHAFWRAQKGGITVTLYKKGKILVQGSTVEGFVLKYLDGGVAQNRSPKDKLKPLPSLKDSLYTIGSDESGKGDYFGPLVVACVYINDDNINTLKRLGNLDSKDLSDRSVFSKAQIIKDCSCYFIRTLMPEMYNDLYQRSKNLNTLLSFTHGKCISDLYPQAQGCQRIIIDQFSTDTASMVKELKSLGDGFLIDIKTKAENEPAVGAASVLARAEFLEKLLELSDVYHTVFPKGAGDKVKYAAKQFISLHGEEELRKVAKTHFKLFK